MFRRSVFQHTTVESKAVANDFVDMGGLLLTPQTLEYVVKHLRKDMQAQAPLLKFVSTVGGCSFSLWLVLLNIEMKIGFETVPSL